jgi:hypothetical protein
MTDLADRQRILFEDCDRLKELWLARENENQRRAATAFGKAVSAPRSAGYRSC